MNIADFLYSTNSCGKQVFSIYLIFGIILIFSLTLCFILNLVQKLKKKTTDDCLVIPTTKPEIISREGWKNNENNKKEVKK